MNKGVLAGDITLPSCRVVILPFDGRTTANCAVGKQKQADAVVVPLVSSACGTTY